MITRLRQTVRSDQARPGEPLQILPLTPPIVRHEGLIKRSIVTRSAAGNSGGATLAFSVNPPHNLHFRRLILHKHMRKAMSDPEIVMSPATCARRIANYHLKTVS